jgi:hypothetical protein
MPKKAVKAAKKRTEVKSLSRKKKMSAAEMKKVKGGLNFGQQNLIAAKDLSAPGFGLLLPAVQKK